ncbi:hypothetical protein WAB17_08825 [Parerythrobacter aurantius]|uniref:hypothetical protein n=1 Tax=Parerythrobacter aurantius TaxID=3127706 RepID=UPI003243C0A2
MRRSTKLIALVSALLVLAGLQAKSTADSGVSIASDSVFKEIIRSHRDKPSFGIASDWHDCLMRLNDSGSKPARELCKTWTSDGYTSELVALSMDDLLVPVIETRSNASAKNEVVVEVTGGPGGGLFYVDPNRLEDIEKFRKLGMKLNGLDRFNIYTQFLDRGYTIASVGYWGTNIRTLNVAGEMELAMDEVRSTVDFYRDSDGIDPPLILTSLGNHLALGALGKERLEGMQFLALVPVMDGLQHHLSRVDEEEKEPRARADAKGSFYGNWTTFNIYKEDGGNLKFDRAQMLDMASYVPQFVDRFDYPWKAVTPASSCSRLILGDRDPRTREYLAANNELPRFVTILPAEHDLFVSSPYDMSLIFEEYADCLSARANP